MIERISTNKRFCFLCGEEVLVDKKGYFLGVKDKYFCSKALCKDCAEVWDKHKELIDEDKTNFTDYANIIKSFVKSKPSRLTYSGEKE